MTRSFRSAPGETTLNAASRVRSALEYLGDNRKILLVFARYVPGLRFVVNATMGLSGLPYLTFLLWSALGGIFWSVYTCALAYCVGSTIEDYPLTSVIVSGAITTGLISILFLREQRRRRRGREADGHSSAASVGQDAGARSRCPRAGVARRRAASASGDVVLPSRIERAKR